VLRQQAEAQLAVRPVEETVAPRKVAPALPAKKVAPALPPKAVTNPSHFTDDEIDALVNELISDEDAAAYNPKWQITKTVADETKALLRNEILLIPRANKELSEDPLDTWKGVKGITMERIAADMLEFGSIKIQLGITVMMRKFTPGKTVKSSGWSYKTFYCRGEMVALTLANGMPDPEQIERFYDDTAAETLETIEGFTQNGSGWQIDHVIACFIELDRFRPIRGASHIPSPQWIVGKKCCINVKNADQDCFRYALISAVDHPEQHGQACST